MVPVEEANLSVSRAMRCCLGSPIRAIFWSIAFHSDGATVRRLTNCLLLG